jgi:hypothetical protein
MIRVRYLPESGSLRLIISLSEVTDWIWESRFRTVGCYKPGEKFIDMLEKE